MSMAIRNPQDDGIRGINNKNLFSFIRFMINPVQEYKRELFSYKGKLTSPFTEAIVLFIGPIAKQPYQ